MGPVRIGHGAHVVGIGCCYAGPVEDGERVVGPLRKFGSPVLDPLRAEAVRRASGDVRPGAAARLALLRPLLRRGGAQRRTINVNAATVSSEGFDEEREWSRALWSALEPHHTSVYVNFLMEEGQERIRQAYGPEKYDRLKALERRYDPDNLFRLNQTIAP